MIWGETYVLKVSPEEATAHSVQEICDKPLFKKCIKFLRFMVDLKVVYVMIMGRNLQEIKRWVSYTKTISIFVYTKMGEKNVVPTSW